MTSIQSMVTIVAPVTLAKVMPLRTRIGEMLGNPADDAFRRAVASRESPPQTPFLHFASLHALARGDGQGGHLVLEFSADGSERVAIDELARRAGSVLKPLFEEAHDWRDGQDLAAYWAAHQVRIGFGLFDTPGLAFCGTPGLDVPTILAEDQLAREVASLLAAPDISAAPPLRKLQAVREHLKASKDLAWALTPQLPANPKPGEEPSLLRKLTALAPSFVTTFLWPLLLLLPLCLWLAWPESWVLADGGARPSDGLGHWLNAGKQLLGFIAATTALMLAFTLAILALAYLAFLRQEALDKPSDRRADADEMKAMVARENAGAHVQNHMMSHTVLKAGPLRGLTIRLAFWAVARLTALNPRVGHLGDIGTIHFARWVTIPGTRDFLFFSNFSGSWESYLEDFITKAHAGLTAVWSNTVGFPRSRSLFLEGATDGERFKRYARQSMVHTPFWYCAYPSLSTANIRANHQVRIGVAAVTTEMGAVDWLTHFGSAPRPVEKLETTQIQSLVFGGMGFKPAGRLLVLNLGPDREKNRQWLHEVLPLIAFNDGRYETRPALLSLALSAGGLARLGLDDDTVASFPAAFTQGMHGPGRERILGDLGGNGKDHWWWGQDGNDVALLVYGDEDIDVEALSRQIESSTTASGGQVAFRQDLTPVGETLSDRKEPFGFVDGVSQPAMRGTYRGLRNDDPIHLVEPGEFVLGYPDNRGNVPPGPLMAADRDSGMHLPVVDPANSHPSESPRLAGYNGSFLVIRQLEQDKTGFRNYCVAQGERLKEAFPDLPLPTGREDMADYIGAKLIGRWQDGSSLVRNPYIPASGLRRRTGSDPGASASRPASHPAESGATAIAPADVRGDEAPADIKPDNDFLFGTEDPQGSRCPYGAHIRRANPRESLSPGSSDQIAISNRHRILRVGRGYLAEDRKSTAGLMFMCLNGDIERQFEFIQQTWMGSTKFHGLSAETDPIAGRGLPGGDGFTIPTRGGPIGLAALPQFVTLRGGGYFFLPGRQLLRYLAHGAGSGTNAGVIASANRAVNP